MGRHTHSLLIISPYTCCILLPVVPLTCQTQRAVAMLPQRWEGVSSVRSGRKWEASLRAQKSGSGRNRFGFTRVEVGGCRKGCARALVEGTKLSCIPRNINGDDHFVTTMRRRLVAPFSHRAFILLRSLPSCYINLTECLT